MSTGDKVGGKVKQAAGELLDDDELKRQGRRDERKGDAKDELARHDELADRKAREIADLEREDA